MLISLGRGISTVKNRSGRNAAALSVVTKQIASRTIASNHAGFGLSNGTNNSVNTRSFHYNLSGQDLTNIQLVYSGWQLDGSSGAEMDGLNAVGIRAAIEYPQGVYTPVYFSGVRDASVPADGNIVSDSAEINIPAGEKFYIRSFASVAAGEKWPRNYNASLLSSKGEAATEGVDLSDLTTSGTISGTSRGFGPSGILSTGTGFNPSFALYGDSIMVGSGVYDSHGYSSFVGRALTTLGLPSFYSAYGGTRLYQQIGNFSRRLALLEILNVDYAVIEWGVNDLSTRSAAQMQNDYSALWAGLDAIGVKVLQTTITPKSSSTDGFYTMENQSVVSTGFTGGASSERAQVNNWIRALPTSLYNYIEVADSVEPARDDGRWIANGENGAYTQSAIVGVVGAGATTTVIPVGATHSSATNYYGQIIFTSGALSGVTASIASNTSTSVTVSAALSSAPAAGDGFILRSVRSRATDDGLHPNAKDNAAPFGGEYALAHATRLSLEELLGL